MPLKSRRVTRVARKGALLNVASLHETARWFSNVENSVSVINLADYRWGVESEENPYFGIDKLFKQVSPV